MLGGKAFSNIRFEVFLRKVNVVSDDFIVIGSWFQVVVCATENANIANIEL